MHRPTLSTKNLKKTFANWVAQLSQMTLTRYFYGVLGRGSAKTTEIQADRFINMAFDMPGAPVVWVSDTYANLQKNVLPSLLEGLERKGYRQGIHYVVGVKPPEYSEAEKADLPEHIRRFFWKPYNKLATYKHTLIFFTGFNVTFGSLDRPASLAGRSYVHVFGDEAKYFPEHKIANIFKANRGYRIQYGHSVFYLGHTLTTDMPNTAHIGEYDWILKLASKMNKSAVLRVLKAAIILNEARKETLYYAKRGDREQAILKSRTEARWMERWIKARLHPDAHTLFFIASSLVNIDILTEQWFSDAVQSDLGDVETAILSLKPSLSSGDRFYANIDAKHFYQDGISTIWAEKLGILDTEDCRLLQFLDRSKEIDLGMDFGNMISMCIAQEGPKYYRVLKFMYVLPPHWIREIADMFLQYFAPHSNKTINLYYDRAANSYAKSGQDQASAMKHALEFDADGKRTGWVVRLMSLRQGNIPQNEEYIFMQELLSESNKAMPKVRIDQYQCKQLKASLEDARTKVDPKTGYVHKDKKSEKLPFERLPMESTNPSDSFKYLMMRLVWRRLVNKHLRTSIQDTTIHH